MTENKKEESQPKNKTRNLLKIGFISSIFYVSTSSGICPCCGTPVASCATGIAGLGLIGITSALFYKGLGYIEKFFNLFKSFLRSVFKIKTKA
ncbi:hypothetical protein ACFL7D_10955 [candidate division KSB1 bacterium]